jgi:hypothetical protein
MAAGLLGGMKHHEQDSGYRSTLRILRARCSADGFYPPGVNFRTLASEAIRSFAADELLTNLYSGPGSLAKS